MAKSAMQKMKLLYLRKILMEETDDLHGLTIAQLSDALLRYGISSERKSLYDDIELLRLYGMDIEMRKEKSVRYHVVSRDFELPELKLLVDSVQASKFITHKKSRELIEKLASETSRYEAQQLQRQVVVSNRVKTMNESIYYTVDEIHSAINRDSKISFQYFEWNERHEKQLRHNGKRYLVSPWALTWDDENYYMIAYDAEHASIRHYRVDKMVRITLTDERRDGGALFKDFDMAQYSKKTFGMYGGKEALVALRCENHLAGVIIDRFGEETSFFRSDEGHFEIRVKVAVSPHFLSWIMSFGSEITVLSPEWVRDEMVALAESAIAPYRH